MKKDILNEVKNPVTERLSGFLTSFGMTEMLFFECTQSS